VLARLVPSGQPTPQIVAAVLIAVGITPARDRLRVLIDRLLYGERADPWSALRRLGQPMAESREGGLLASVVRALADALHVQGIALLDSEGSDAVSYGEVAGRVTDVPLQFAGTALGVLRVAPRSGERSLGRADVRLLEGVAPLLAAVSQAERLADDVRLERTRVVEATQAERRRLRQELHDGLGPALTGIGLGLEAVGSTPLASDPRTSDLVARLRVEVASSLEEIRRIIDDLRPGILDDRDLLTALHQRSEQMSSATGVRVRLDAPTHLPDLPPALEAAAYRIADEALVNVVRHAAASNCTLLLTADDALRLSVADDGVGINGGRENGVGLTSMRERAERLGGTFSLRDLHPGTEVVAELPL
jgi:signal transduction histidine kinase